MGQMYNFPLTTQADTKAIKQKTVWTETRPHFVTTKEQSRILSLFWSMTVLSVSLRWFTNTERWGENTKNMFVTVTNKKPVIGKIAEGEILGSFAGPGTNGQVITIKAAGKTPVGKYVVIQMRTKGVLSLADVKVECPGPPPCTSVTEANVQLSTDHPSRHKSYQAKNCVDGDPSTFCHNKGTEQNPFLVLEYDSPVSVPEVVVTNRNMYGERTKNMFVTVTNK